MAHKRCSRPAKPTLSRCAHPVGPSGGDRPPPRTWRQPPSDRLASVSPLIGHATEVAQCAESGSQYLLGARESALEAITQAELDGFTVHEDLSVIDNSAGGSPAERAARRAAAIAHRNYIAHWAARLEAANSSIAAQLNSELRR